jgi:hypothetical protein
MLLKRNGEEQDSGFGIQERQDQGTHANQLDRAGWVSSPARLNKGILFLQDRRGNVIENKGALWKKPSRSGNVYENKGDSRLRRECC